jgi:protein-S-isoprenylcysteine O-methyltransferase Ste14
MSPEIIAAAVFAALLLTAIAVLVADMVADSVPRFLARTAGLFLAVVGLLVSAVLVFGLGIALIEVTRAVLG